MGRIGIQLGLLFALPLLFAGAVGIASAYLAWTWAPIVGGEWYPYIRVAVALIAGIIGAKVAVLVAAVVGVLITVTMG